MKRDPALVPLSREHHEALALARRAGGGADASAVREQVLRRWSEQIGSHFLLEELVLLPAMRAAGAHGLADTALRQHEELRRLVDALQAGDDAALPRWGAAMREHVQFEERELFDVAQRVVDLEPLTSALACTPKEH
jgi:hemerythrin-like domain-containing protein